MTEPTDNELDIVLSKHWPAFATMGTLPLIWTRAAFREAIAKWGTPPAVAGEPVAWLSTDCIGERYLCFTKPKDSDQVRPLVFGDTTQQPTQPQAGAVPLTCEWTHNDDDGFWETACGEAWRFDDGGPGENNMHFCHSCGNSLRIKGGQHGAK